MNMTKVDAPPAEEWIKYHLRPMEARDGAAYTELMASSPETGMITIQTTFKLDPYEMLMQRRLGQVVVIAETPDGRVVGTGAADARPVWFEGQPVQSVHLSNLLVHPDFRQHGVATAVVQWRIAWAHEHYGPDTLIFAEIQQSNLAAFKNASKWASNFGTPRESGFLRVYGKEPTKDANLTFREATEADYPTIAEALNQFNHNVNFTRYVTPDRLHRNLEAIHGKVFRHRWVVLKNGQIVGGAVLSAHDPSIVTRMVKAPFINRTIARLSGMIHSDGELNSGELDGVWFRPGEADSTHQLVEWLRYKASAEVDSLNFTAINPNAFDAMKLSRWQPHTVQSVAYYRPAHLKRFEETTT